MTGLRSGGAIARKSAAGLAACLLMTGMAASAQAGLTVIGTRFVYPAQAKSLTIRTGNSEDAPILVQAWLDQERAQTRTDPSELPVPFVLTPPVYRLDPGERKALELRYTGEPLATDRESVFWINFLEIPSQPAAQRNRLQLSFRLRMKVLFRPPGLKGSPQEAPAQITWKYQATGNTDESWQLEARNPTPFFVSLARIELPARDGPLRMDGLTLAPYATSLYTLPAGHKPQAGTATLSYEAAGDAGDLVRGAATLSAAD
ncbi:fimbria/pilus periplasmic chaperone [Achromobacter sp. SD115]|uniref:fimbrial biogenesis chaperone n=1 Tax=Achromobacter sp. SD115 TaxID=2782011 RepID=UPI001A96FDF2|nr:fimbria/pilus periplasmic chaperone [Achromobacter sp. SD115]MBO1014517.1 fimbria/pilus periplasmic chaperone [Achromobacter sp. SD115]